METSLFLSGLAVFLVVVNLFVNLFTNSRRENKSDNKDLLKEINSVQIIVAKLETTLSDYTDLRKEVYEIRSSLGKMELVINNIDSEIGNLRERQTKIEYEIDEIRKSNRGIMQVSHTEEQIVGIVQRRDSASNEQA